MESEMDPNLRLSSVCIPADSDDCEMDRNLKRQFTQEDIDNVKTIFQAQNHGDRPVTIEEFKEFRENLKGIDELEKEKKDLKKQIWKKDLEIRQYRQNATFSPNMKKLFGLLVTFMMFYALFYVFYYTRQMN